MVGDKSLWLIIAFLLIGWGLNKYRRSWVVPIISLTWLILTLVIAWRWRLIGHPPIFGTFENSLAGAWALITIYLINRLSLLLPASAGILIYGWWFNRHPLPLTISERSLWVDLHAFLAWLGFASFWSTWALTWKKTDERNSSEWRRNMLNNLNIAFTAWTGMLATGMWYQYLLFGVWWRWDFIEVVCLIVWLMGAWVLHYLHFQPRFPAIGLWIIRIIPVPLLIVFFGLIILYMAGSFHVFDLPF